ncbi:MAG: helix-turn-helix domain-containing protein [Pseudonocardiales bacterium]|nr:helix-turn-helix domain-containing protein [Pseudonocardiales bacterium]MBV9029345.1 helix-turn-helix domain-containing protein [Pseudonocardiales bacterium]
MSQSGADPTDGHAPVQPQAPTVLRIALGAELRRLREASGTTIGAAAHAIRVSHAKISRMELGRVGFKERDVADLLTLYGITDEQERGAFLALARRSNVPGWWHDYSDVLPSWFEMYLGLEQASSLIRTYEPQLMPGLLQTREVARAVVQLGDLSGSGDDIERRVALRMRRQEMLTQPGAPQLWAVIDEAALWRIDGRSVIRAQLQHLIEMAELPNITLQVIPIYSGAHPAVGGPFTILRFSEPDLPDIVYLEQLASALYLDKRWYVRHYLVVMDRLCVQAKCPAETTRFFSSTLAEL